MADQAEIFLGQAELAETRSRLYARLWRDCAHDARVAEIVGPSPAWDAPLRLLAGVHYLVLTGAASWDAFGNALVDHREFLREWVKTRGVQTNEVQRCWMLLPCFLEAVSRNGARELDLVELGPAAGLNLVWDRYRYGYEGGAWGPESSPVCLEGDEARPVPERLLALRPRVRSRVGIDRDPVDVTSDDGALLLKAFVWADQTGRLARLDAAVGAVRSDPPDIVRGEVATLLPEVLDGLAEDDALPIVWETAVLGYVPEDGRRRVFDALARFGERRPLAFVRTGHASDGVMAHYGLTLQLWPGGEREELAYATHHGDWLDWLGG